MPLEQPAAGLARHAAIGGADVLDEERHSGNGAESTTLPSEASASSGVAATIAFNAGFSSSIARIPRSRSSAGETCLARTSSASPRASYEAYSSRFMQHPQGDFGTQSAPGVTLSEPS